MKKHSIIISALLFSVLGFSQGIKFEQGTWKEVLEKARQINKPIFLNIYKSWSASVRRSVVWGDVRRSFQTTSG